MSLKVLYVEDDPANRRLIYMIVEREKYEFHSANDGESGIAAAIELQPDVILMDINLPGIDGEEACLRLKATEETQHIPIIALTARSMDGDRQHLLRMGFDEYIPKPINRLMLINTIQRTLRMRG